MLPTGNVNFIRSKFGINYTCTGLVALLHKLGFSYKKTYLVACEVDAEAQKAFVEQFHHLVCQAQEAGDVVYFADGVHPPHNTQECLCLDRKRTRARDFVGERAFSAQYQCGHEGRKSVVMIESKSVNAQSTLALYKKLEMLHSEAKNIWL